MSSIIRAAPIISQPEVEKSLRYSANDMQNMNFRTQVNKKGGDKKQVGSEASYLKDTILMSEKWGEAYIRMTKDELKDPASAT